MTRSEIGGASADADGLRQGPLCLEPGRHDDAGDGARAQVPAA